MLISVRIAGSISAPPIPSRTAQPIINVPMLVAKPVIPVPMANMTVPMTRVRLRPQMSPNLPPVIISAASTSEYKVITPWTEVTLVLRSFTTWEMDTFIMDVSIMMMKTAVDKTISGDHLLVHCTGCRIFPLLSSLKGARPFPL